MNNKYTTWKERSTFHLKSIGFNMVATAVESSGLLSQMCYRIHQNLFKLTNLGQTYGVIINLIN